MCIFLLNWGAQVGQLLVLGDAAPAVLKKLGAGNSVYFNRSYVIVFATILASPLCFFKSVGRLGVPAMLSQIFLSCALGPFIASSKISSPLQNYLILFYGVLIFSFEGLLLFNIIEKTSDAPIREKPLKDVSLLGVLCAVGGTN